jgi:hypothetical protein
VASSWSRRNNRKLYRGAVVSSRVRAMTAAASAE